jgi:hypothetical protein
MVLFRVHRLLFAGCRTFLGLALLAGAGRCQSAPEQLNTGQNPPSQSTQSQPGRVNPDQSQPAQNTRAAPPPARADANQSQSAPMVFESHGLEYDAITRNGVTVMFAQLPSRLKEFNIIQITVTNGSPLSWTVRSGDFNFVRSDGVVLESVSADYVVETLLAHANRDDVIKLELLYENSISGLANFRSTNGFEKRREAAMVQFVNRGFKAAAQASAIAFVATKLKSGDSTDGAIFFHNRTKERTLGAGRLVAHTCGETFIFETYEELKKH